MPWRKGADCLVFTFILPKAKLIVDRSVKPKNGDIVLAIINSEFTVKYLKKNDFKCWLIPANNRYKEILDISAQSFPLISDQSLPVMDLGGDLFQSKVYHL